MADDLFTWHADEYVHVARLVNPRSDLWSLSSPISLHEEIRRGFPRSWWAHFMSSVEGVPVEDVGRVLHISSRVLQRIKPDDSSESTRMDAMQSSMLWSFAEVLSKAVSALGSRQAAVEWLRRKAVGLEGRSPLELMETPQGTEIVKTLLDRMEYGVYA